MASRWLQGSISNGGNQAVVGFCQTSEYRHNKCLRRIEPGSNFKATWRIWEKVMYVSRSPCADQTLLASLSSKNLPSLARRQA